jgi:hypothetical protein
MVNCRGTRQATAAKTMTDEEKDERERWLDQRLEEERERTLDMVAKVVGRMLAERADRGADYLINGEIAALWRTISELQGSLAALHRERRRRRRGEKDELTRLSSSYPRRSDFADNRSAKRGPGTTGKIAPSAPTMTDGVARPLSM